MFYRIGRWAYCHRRLVVLVWAFAFLLAIPILPRMTEVLKVGGFSNPTIEAARARQLLEEEIPSFAPSTLVVIFQSDDLTAFDPRYAAAADSALAGVMRLPEVTGITAFQGNPAQISRDGYTAYSLVQLSLSPEQSQRLMPAIRAGIVEPPDISVTLAGAPAFYEDVERISEQDLRRAELIAIPFALVALVIVFGSVVGAAVPLAVGALSVAAVIGLLWLIAHVIDMSIFVLNLTTMLGLGLAIDYSLFMTSRFREEMTHRPLVEAIAVTAGTAGRAVFFSGLTVLIGLAGLALFDFMFLRSVGVAGALVVAVAVLGALTLLPAVLGFVGPHIDRLRLVHRGNHHGGTFWTVLAGWVMRHPWRVFVPVIVFLVTLGLPFANVELSSPDATILPLRVESRQGFEALRREFGDGEISPIVVALRSPGDLTSPSNLTALWEFTRHFAADERVTRIDSLVTLDPRLSLAQYDLLYNTDQTSDPFMSAARDKLSGPDATVVLLYTRGLPTDDANKALLHDIRAWPVGGDLEILVDGGTAEVVDVVDEMYAEFPRVAAVVVLSTYLVLLFLFRSVVLPLKAILMNALSIVASYGALVFIFQEGHFSNVLDFEPLGFVEASLPILMFCLLFGLSMDYEVFLLSRVREAYLETHDNTASVAVGLQRSGRIITGAALIVVVVTLSFVSAEIVLVKALGLGIALAVLLDATIVRALLVPATMRLLGDLNWWLPAWLARLLPKKEFEH
ncbi:MAG TPA: MMPL family transporter [Thermomicrobiales bacterium]|nr:MMPL family transporter [Thermomicrobiales bacterium]